jgi:UDP:flavonoid glycosyltransferase YjiC (YdhE family)
VRNVAPHVRWKPASFRRVAAERGVRLPSRTLEALDADLNLIASVLPTTDSPATETGEIAVGPIFAQSDGELPSSVNALAGSDRPLVYVGLGSSGNRRLALDILQQVAELDVEIVSSVGRRLQEGDAPRLPSPVHVCDVLPAPRLAGLVDASVIHGGEGTVQTACASGAPFAGIGLQTEQRHNIDACAQMGNALRFTPLDIRRRVNRALTDVGGAMLMPACGSEEMRLVRLVVRPDLVEAVLTHLERPLGVRQHGPAQTDEVELTTLEQLEKTREAE